ncbi:MAG: IclR family transcriptional regulator [Thermomicrobiaceae bacterium]|nr:IclR family transcriptional regulator [Thermomicrobiaceae bacterium]
MVASDRTEARLAQTVLKAVDALECLARADRPLTAQQVARQVGLSRTTAYRLLSTLAARGYVASLPGGRFRLGPGVLWLGQRLLEQLELPEIARPYLREVGRQANETTYLALLDGTEVLYVDRVESSQPVRLHSVVGTRNPLHCTSLGKAILAFLPEAERRALVDALPLPRRTANTITDRELLWTHLDLVRARGYAVDDIENEEGVRCVGAPIFDHQGRPFAAISVAGPAYRMTPERVAELAAVVTGAAQAISRELGHQPAAAPATPEAAG